MLGAVLRADGEGDRTGRDIEEVTIHLGVFQHFSRGTEVIGGHEDFADDGGSVQVDAEGVESGGRIGIEQPDAQSVIVDDAAEALYATIVVIAEAHFPVPGLQVITKFTQVPIKASGEDVVIRGDLVRAQARFEPTITNACGESRPGRGRAGLRVWEKRVEPAVRNVVWDRERIKCVLDRNADTGRADAERVTACCFQHSAGQNSITASVRKDVWRKGSRSESAIKEGASVFKVRESGQILVADVTRE